MPNVNLSPIGNTQFSYDDGTPADGSLLWTYIAGSTTPLTTYTSSSGLIAQTNPIVLNSLGLPTIGEVFLIEGLTYDIVWEDKPIFPATHGAVLKTFEDIDGINDNATTTNQWISSGVTPTYISASSFSLQGDQTTEFHSGRMAQFLVTAGTVYGKIINSVFSASITTVTMLMLEGGTLDSGLTTANLSFLRADHSALPNPIEFIRSTVVANAITTPLWDRAYGEVQDWTGVVTITALPNAPRPGSVRKAYPAVGTVITHGGNISVQGGVNISAAEGDEWTISAITISTFYVSVVSKNGGTAGIAQGNCRLAKSGSNIVLSPFKGNKLTIAGAQQSVPSAGVSLAPTGLVVSTLYYVYAYMSGSTMTLEASTTTHVTDSGSGIEVKSGDTTRTLVGMVRPITGPAFQDAGSQRFVRSYFNRVNPVGRANFSANRSTASTSFVELNTEIRVEMLLFADESISAAFSGAVQGSGGGAVIQTSLGIDSATVTEDVLTIYTVAAIAQDTGIFKPASFTFQKDGISEGYHYFSVLGSTSAGTSTWLGSVSSGNRSTLSVKVG